MQWEKELAKIFSLKRKALLSEPDDSTNLVNLHVLKAVFIFLSAAVTLITEVLKFILASSLLLDMVESNNTSIRYIISDT